MVFKKIKLKLERVFCMRVENALKRNGSGLKATMKHGRAAKGKSDRTRGRINTNVLMQSFKECLTGLNVECFKC